ncbi:MAG: 16S rRNA (adenine(1518)-N(6)/adenine(1519)-N(6))-dimethyltransferase RsmA [Synergistaceae bacterium]|jgi:16S rRNA (adenine1518-N6/adenine1519-N6)-dimethyltransferase|nr:16S rRNA (adenine(1518)-N(6)/adenine(1519)-N(6))-dimethyltransferase RsmA [Synergistaceae bacterium]
MTFRHNTDIGQNFLRDSSVADWMAGRALRAPGPVLEIGPGSGVLTKAILKSGCPRLDAVELDTRLAPELEPLTKDPRFRLHWGDAVRFDYSKAGIDPVSVVANLPYHITTPVIWRMLEIYPSGRMTYMLLMTQAEAAERLSCGAGRRTSDPLSVTIAALGGASVVRKVSRSAFYPVPRVDSAIVEITLGGSNAGAKSLPADKIWRRLLSGSFASRRKTIVNNWAASFRVTRAESAEILARRSLGELARPEGLSLEDWLSLRGDALLEKIISGER